MMSTTKCILLVDDNTLNRRLVIAMLTGLPYTITERDNGREALEYLVANAGGTDLVLLDIGMPGLSGIDLCKIVRSSEDTSLRNLPVIAYTAHAMRQEQELYLSIGFNDILIKPMTKSDLLRTVSKYVS
jgi:CheY-like chemotaxis protein